MAKNDNSSGEDIEIENEETVPVESDAEEETDDQADEIAELTADIKRVQAEFVNYRRRAEAEKAEVHALAKSRAIREFLAVRDSFDQEITHRPKNVDPKWAATIDSIRAQFDQVLTSLGAEKFESKGYLFDPHKHDAIAMDEGEGEFDVVTEELQPGYKLGDQILRHAIVKVGKSVEPPQSEPKQ